MNMPKEEQQQLKIGLVCDDTLDKTDGVQQYVLTLGKWLSTQGHEVHYLTSTTERTDIPNIHSLSRNVHVRFNSNRNRMPLPASPSKIKGFLALHQFDVLHVQMPYSPLLAGQVIRAAAPSTAVVGTFHVFPHNALMSLGTKALGYAVHFQLKRFDEIISVSTAAQKFSRGAFGINTTVIPNMMDVGHFKVQKSPVKTVKTVKSRENPVKIVFLGRLVERKGAGQLIKAIAFLRRQYKTVHPYEVVIGGKGPLFAELDSYVSEHKLDDIVKFTGFVDEADKPAFLASADIAVFPSTGGESFGISLIEAMAATPGVVIAGDNEGYRTVMEGSKKQLVDPYDIPSFAHLLASYIDDQPRRTAAHKWQQKHVQQFDIGVVGPKVAAKYIQALQKRRG